MAANIYVTSQIRISVDMKSHNGSVNKPCSSGLIPSPPPPGTMPELETWRARGRPLLTPRVPSASPCQGRGGARPPHRPIGSPGRRASPAPRPRPSRNGASASEVDAGVGGALGGHVQRRRQRRACARSYVGLGRRRAGQGGSGRRRGLQPSLTAGELEGPVPDGCPWPWPGVGRGVGRR